MKPTATFASSMRRTAMPPSPMMAPASTKKGMARSEKSSVPSDILSITASSGMSTQKAAASAASPSAYATGMPIAHSTVKAPSRTSASTLLGGHGLVAEHHGRRWRRAYPQPLDDEEQRERARDGQ